MTIDELCENAYAAATAKGWHEGKERSLLEDLALIHSEVSEAVEAVRNNEPTWWIDLENNRKPEGIIAELADAVIRIAHLCGQKGWNLERAIIEKMRFNATRPHRHGGKLY
jgi:NTP pyrophosphatase (non-canonical NTP hydrolase)